MRKNVLCVLLSVLCMTVGALGEGAYEDIGALYQHWCMTEFLRGCALFPVPTAAVID